MDFLGQSTDAPAPEFKPQGDTTWAWVACLGIVAGMTMISTGVLSRYTPEIHHLDALNLLDVA